MDTILWIIDRILEWKSADREMRLRAIDGLTPAVNETVIYTRRLSKGHPRDTDKEDQLYIIWGSASSMVAPLDKQLAKDCLAKAEYWLMPQHYSQAKIDELNIRLVRMQAILEQLKHQ